MALTDELNSIGFSPKPPIGEQVTSLRRNSIVLPTPEEILQQHRATEETPFTNLKTIQQEASEWTQGEATAWAGWMGTLDTVRGVKQLVGWSAQEEADQRLLNELMEHPEWGGGVKAAWMIGMVADPVGLIVPFAKVRTLGKMAVAGAAWGGGAGYLGYVDENISDRWSQAMYGAATVGVLAPSVSFGRQTISQFVAKRKAKDLTADPAATIREFTGSDLETITGKVKKFFIEPYQTSVRKYYDFTHKNIYQPVFDNPIPSLVGAGTAFATWNFADDFISSTVDRKEEEGDLDTGSLSQALIGVAGILAAGLSGRGAKWLIDETKLGGEMAHRFGRAFIERYNLPTEYTNMMDRIFMDVSSREQEFLRIAATLGKQPASVKRLVYEFLDGRARIDPWSKKLIDPDTGNESIAKEVHEIAFEARALIKDLGRDMVDAGLITEKSWQRNLNKYIHRTYITKELKAYPDDIEEKKLLAARDMLGVIGTTSMARGHPVHIKLHTKGPNKGKPESLNKVKKLEADGYKKEATIKHPHTNQPTHVVMRRQLTLKERKNIGEVEDGAFAIAATGRLMLNDYAVYKIYDGVNVKYGKSPDEWAALSKEDRALYLQVPETFIPHTGNNLQKFGNLTGQYIPKDMYSDLNIQRMWKDYMVHENKLVGGVAKAFNAYRKWNRRWKRSVTIWNPTVHANNTISNFVLLDLHDVPITNLFKYGRKIWTEKGRQSLNLDFKDLGPIYDDLIRLNVFDAGLLKSELGMSRKEFLETYGKEFHNLKIDDGHVSSIEASANISGRIWEKLKSGVGGLDRTQGIWYQNEDSMFRVAHYVHNLNKRISEIKIQGLQIGTKEYNTALETAKIASAKDAKRAFIDYNITAPGVQVLRETAVPFIAYTWRVAPILAEIATKKPHKFIKWAAIGYALNYAGNEQSGRDEEYERHLMDKEFSSHIFGIPFLMPFSYIKAPNMLKSLENIANKRLDAEFDFDINDQRSFFWNVRRWIPGGDVLGMASVGDGWVPGLPAPLQPTLGLLGALATPILFNRDPFTLEQFDKKSDERTSWLTKMGERRILPALSRLIPNNPLFGTYGIDQINIPGTDAYIRMEGFNSWSHKRIMKSLQQRKGVNPYAEDMPLWMAIVHSVSVKLWPWDEDIARNGFATKITNQMDERRRQISKIERDLELKWGGTPSYSEKLKDAERRIRLITQEISDILLEAQRAATLKRRSKN